MSATNDSRFWLRIAPEATYGVAPAYILTLTGATGGTFAMSLKGVASAANIFNVTAANLKTALNTAWGSSTISTVTGSAGGPYTITFASGPTTPNPSLQVANLTVDGALLTGTTPTAVLTGGPVWMVVKVPKVVPPDMKTGVQADTEERNSPDKHYEDSVTQGGAWSLWKWQAGLRADQVGHFFALCGLSDAISTVETGVYDHTFKGGTGDGRSYSVQLSDGKVTYSAVGLVGTDLKGDIKNGEKGHVLIDFAGWSSYADIDTSAIINPTLPSNTAYHKIAPTATGYAFVLGASGGSATSLVKEFKFDYKRDAKPIWTGGTVHPYRAEYGPRNLTGDLMVLFDDATEALAARAMTLPISVSVVMPGPELIGATSHPQVTFALPAGVYTDWGSDTGTAAATLKLKLQGLYNTAQATQLKLTVRNETTPAYT